MVTFDIDPHYIATFHYDILEFPYRKFWKRGEFDLVFACPPCTEYSRALTTRPPDLDCANGVVKKILEIIKYLAPPC